MCRQRNPIATVVWLGIFSLTAVIAPGPASTELYEQSESAAKSKNSPRTDSTKKSKNAKTAGQSAKNAKSKAGGAKTSTELHIDRRGFIDSAGRPVRLQGVNIPSLEWRNDGDHIIESTRVAFQDWKANVVRIPVCQDRWFGKTPNQDEDPAERYRSIVDLIVRIANEHSGYVILDLHWSDAGVWGKNIGQHKMPDEHSLEFWKDAARRYANHPAVIFDLYNEPFQVSWDVWKNGGDVTETDSKTKETLAYRAVGLQRLLDTVRETGAKNVVVAGGLDWSYDLRGVASGYALADPKGRGVIYATHIYPWKKDWDSMVGSVADKYPVFVGEVGCEPDPKHEDPFKWGPKVLNYIDAHGWSWTAWCFHTEATPRMLKDWTYTPTEYWGSPVLKKLKDMRN